MDRKCYTIILVPHTRARFRKIQVSTAQIWGALAVVLTMTATASVLAWLYLTAPVDERQIARLHGENDELRSVNAQIEVLHGEAHQRFQEVPDEFNARVDAFWREVEARA